MTQVQTLVRMLKRQWVSTADAFGAGITSFHRRLEDFREAHPKSLAIVDADSTHLYGHSAHWLNGKPYTLDHRERTIKTRWGKARIKEYKLVPVK